MGVQGSPRSQFPISRESLGNFGNSNLPENVNSENSLKFLREGAKIWGLGGFWDLGLGGFGDLGFGQIWGFRVWIGFGILSDFGIWVNFGIEQILGFGV